MLGWPWFGKGKGKKLPKKKQGSKKPEDFLEQMFPEEAEPEIIPSATPSPSILGTDHKVLLARLKALLPVEPDGAIALLHLLVQSQGQEKWRSYRLDIWTRRLSTFFSRKGESPDLAEATIKSLEKKGLVVRSELPEGIFCKATTKLRESLVSPLDDDSFELAALGADPDAETTEFTEEPIQLQPLKLAKS